MEFLFIIPVLAADENEPVRKSLHYLVATADDIKIVATAINGIEAVEIARSDQPDVAVMDGIEATEHIRECCRLTRVIIFSGLNDPESIRRAVEVGAKGCVLKDEAASDLLEGVRTVHKGKHYFSHQIDEIAEKYLTERE